MPIDLGRMKCECGYEDDLVPNIEELGLTFTWKSTGEPVIWTPDDGPVCPKCKKGEK